MGEVYSFKAFQSKKEKESKKQDPRTTVAIYRSVIYYVHLYSDETDQHPLEYLTTNIELADIFKNDRDKFLEAFAALIKHWELPQNSHQELPENRELTRFSTLGDLCMYIEKKVKDL
ncbi:hypothetical protein LC065_16840 [Halobacillus litoralis]|uniref:hypothetical protein n=1 Tax=Halobacillus litoralis TaxID=45668 RepID=UPI001CFEA23E|nr:hypothetical protein [Halobacillus litoralis]WLR47168.1 hypothetical protein LC065_16840 [Halobacillus litoralis]